MAARLFKSLRTEESSVAIGLAQEALLDEDLRFPRKADFLLEWCLDKMLKCKDEECVRMSRELYCKLKALSRIQSSCPSQLARHLGVAPSAVAKIYSKQQNFLGCPSGSYTHCARLEYLPSAATKRQASCCGTSNCMLCYRPAHCCSQNYGRSATGELHVVLCFMYKG